jgi:hypothetical protein
VRGDSGNVEGYEGDSHARDEEDDEASAFYRQRGERGTAQEGCERHCRCCEFLRCQPAGRRCESVNEGESK